MWLNENEKSFFSWLDKMSNRLVYFPAQHFSTECNQIWQKQIKINDSPCVSLHIEHNMYVKLHNLAHFLSVSILSHSLSLATRSFVFGGKPFFFNCYCYCRCYRGCHTIHIDHIRTHATVTVTRCILSFVLLRLRTIWFSARFKYIFIVYSLKRTINWKIEPFLVHSF